MSPPYRHTQRATTILLSAIVSAVLACLIVIVWIVSREPQVDITGLAVALAIVVLLMSGVAWYFSSMTVEVSGDELRWTVGAAGRTALHWRTSSPLLVGLNILILRS